MRNILQKIHTPEIDMPIAHAHVWLSVRRLPPSPPFLPQRLILRPQDWREGGEGGRRRRRKPWLGASLEKEQERFLTLTRDVFIPMKIYLVSLITWILEKVCTVQRCEKMFFPFQKPPPPQVNKKGRRSINWVPPSPSAPPSTAILPEERFFFQGDPEDRSGGKGGG